LHGNQSFGAAARRGSAIANLQQYRDSRFVTLFSAID
jgi:hypothetical protein